MGSEDAQDWSHADVISRVSMTQVAAAAGVSAQTVSKVVNNQPGVSVKTRRRIEKLIEQMNYRPNLPARWLRTGVTPSIGLISLERLVFGQAMVVHGVEQAARQDGFFSTVAGVAEVTSDHLEDAVSRLVSLAVAGIVLNLPIPTGSHVLDGLQADVPLVGIWTPTNLPFPVATYDNVAGGFMATRHLLSLGHRTVHHLGGVAEQSGADRRATGWRRALIEAGAPVEEPVFGDWTADSGYERGKRLARQPDVTAVFAANDAIALGLISALREAGRAVPEEVSVVGYDDLPESAFYDPPLTTVHQDFLALGERAYALLAQQIRHDQSALLPKALELELVVRASSVPPRAQTCP